MPRAYVHLLGALAWGLPHRSPPPALPGKSVGRGGAWPWFPQTGMKSKSAQQRLDGLGTQAQSAGHWAQVLDRGLPLAGRGGLRAAARRKRPGSRVGGSRLWVWRSGGPGSEDLRWEDLGICVWGLKLQLRAQCCFGFSPEGTWSRAPAFSSRSFYWVSIISDWYPARPCMGRRPLVACGQLCLVTSRPEPR